MAKIVGGTTDEYFKARGYVEAGVPERFLSGARVQLRPSGVSKSIYAAACEARSILALTSEDKQSMAAARAAGLYIAERRLRETIETERPVRVKRFSLFNLFSCYREMSKNAEFARIISALFDYGELLIINDFSAKVRALWQADDRRWLQWKVKQARTGQDASIVICCDRSMELEDMAEFFGLPRKKIQPFLIEAARETENG